jgi:dihydrofolate reductase
MSSSNRPAAAALVVAVARNGIIGEHNGLPWKLPSELRRFRQITLGHPCLMGRKTWEGLKGPLKGRDNIVLTRGSAIAREGVLTVRSLAEGLAVGRQLAGQRGASWVMVIGGGEVYAQALPLANRLYLTQVDMDAVGDTSFPALDPGQWHETTRESHAVESGDSCGYVMLTLDRIG